MYTQFIVQNVKTKMYFEGFSEFSSAAVFTRIKADAIFYFNKASALTVAQHLSLFYGEHRVLAVKIHI